MRENERARTNTEIATSRGVVECMHKKASHTREENVIESGKIRARFPFMERKRRKKKIPLMEKGRKLS